MTQRGRHRVSGWNTIANRLARANMRLRLFTPRLREFCFVIGAMKSGTTTLYHYLAQHPQIAPNHFQKEPEFFSGETAPADLAPFYRQYLPRPFTRQIALDASTGYAKRPAFPDVAERLARLPGRKHFIYMVRHPVDRLESHMAHNIAAGAVTFGPNDWPDDVDHDLAVSRYAYQLDAYRAAFPGIPVKIVDFQRLASDPLALVRDLCSHLGIDPGFAFKELPPQNTRSRRSDVQAFRLTDTQRAVVTERLRPDVLRLRDTYGFDVSPWGMT